jgi:hypothetical protein
LFVVYIWEADRSDPRPSIGRGLFLPNERHSRSAIADGWNEIPGARGCTPQTCAFRDQVGGFEKLGVEVFGISAQSPVEQAEFAARLQLPFELLSDEKLELASALRLPVCGWRANPHPEDHTDSCQQPHR